MIESREALQAFDREANRRRSLGRRPRDLVRDANRRRAGLKAGRIKAAIPSTASGAKLDPLNRAADRRRNGIARVRLVIART